MLEEKRGEVFHGSVREYTQQSGYGTSIQRRMMS